MGGEIKSSIAGAAMRPARFIGVRRLKTRAVAVRQPLVTEAVFVFGEIAQCFGEWKCRFGHAI